MNDIAEYRMLLEAARERWTRLSDEALRQSLLQGGDDPGCLIDPTVLVAILGDVQEASDDFVRLLGQLLDQQFAGK